MADKQREQTSMDCVPTRIGQAVMLHRAGDREEARNRLRALWDELGPEGDPLRRCTVAHYLAGTQDDPRDGLRWDLRALEAVGAGRPAPTVAIRVPLGRPADPGPALRLRAFLPSLHLSLAGHYAALGRTAQARGALRRARQALEGLADDPHRQGVREAVARLEARLDAD